MKLIRIAFILFYFPIILLAIHVRVIPELIWGQHFRGNFTTKCSVPCIWDDADSDIDGIFNIVMNNHDIQQAIARSHLSPINIVGCKEGGHYYNLTNREYLREQHQVSALLDRKSDIPWPHPRTVDFVAKQKILQSTKAAPKALFAAKNCNSANNREGLVKSIMDHIPIDSLSSCLNNGEWPYCGEVLCSKIEVANRYKFLLSFESGNYPGYVTEKIHDAYAAGVLPVYYGTSDIIEVVPRGSYIDASDFNSFDEVGIYLKKVLVNETLYNSYFDWKKQPLDTDFVSYMQPIWSNILECRVCKYIDTMKRGLEWDKIMQGIKQKIVTRPNKISQDRKQNIVSRPDNAIALTLYRFNNAEENRISFLTLFIFLFTILIVCLYIAKSYILSINIFKHFLL